MKLTIIGASGHGKVVAEIATLNGYDEIEFLDDNNEIVSCGKYPIVGRCNDAANVYNDIFVAIGNASVRKKFMTELSDKHFSILIHPSSIVSDDAEIGKGSVVMAGVVINPYVTIGEGAIINTCSSVDHDCVVGDFAHVSGFGDSI